VRACTRLVPARRAPLHTLRILPFRLHISRHHP
jgi:hypothetical protein